MLLKFIFINLFLALSVKESLGFDFESVSKLVQKYKYTTERPKTCPLESKKLTDLIIKTEMIKDVFKSNCFGSDEKKMADIVSSVNDVQEELKKKNVISQPLVLKSASNATATTSTNTASSPISGAKLSSLFSNITTVIKKHQCNLEDGRVLEVLADVINDSTQFGLISGTSLGVIVAGGGFVVSSALRLIDLIFKEKFDFENNQSRQTFIKLNCSFYDIRKDMEGLGVLEVETNESRMDLARVKDLSLNLKESMKQIDKDLETQKEDLDMLDEETLIETVGDVRGIKKSLLKIKNYLLNGFNDSSLLPPETQKMLLISRLAEDYILLKELVMEFKTFQISTMPMFEDLFLVEVEKFNSKKFEVFRETLNIEVKAFNETLKPRILFYLSRILNDISLKEVEISKGNETLKKNKAGAMFKRKEMYIEKAGELASLETLLTRINYSKEYSGIDEGSDNMISLIDNYENISHQIYGEWGEKFLDYTTQKSSEMVLKFNEKLIHFHKKYSKLSEAEKKASVYICQDLQSLRKTYKYSDSLVQEGYDFMATSKDLFRTDEPDTFFGHKDEEEGYKLSHTMKIQRHYKSTLLALRKLKNGKISNEDEKTYLSKSFMGESYLGKSMVEVSYLKYKAAEVQKSFADLKCSKILSEDLK